MWEVCIQDLLEKMIRIWRQEFALCLVGGGSDNGDDQAKSYVGWY